MIGDTSKRVLTPGTQLGPYRIEEPLGAGGMGQVYRALDTRLDRTVAIKVLAEEFNGRFDREARAISALNHRNICTLHDIGPDYLVLELVEGPTLADRLKQGALPLDEALDIARQIADALEAAHERGIIHRDLKPANVKITPDGTVKVLDFGLAKVATAPAADTSDVTQALTLTEAGAVVGTPAYLAPEQACGKPIDKRADIWAFGVVLYEMLTGKRLFKGGTVSETLAAVLTKEPEWDAVPPKVGRLLRRCLERDPKERLRDIGDARFLLDGSAVEPIPAARTTWPWKAGAAALCILLATALALLWSATRPRPSTVTRLSVDLGDDAALAPRRGAALALSPDGSHLVFITGEQITRAKLAVLRLDQSKPLPLAGSEGAEAPFFSPDGKSIAFFAEGKLKRMDIAGGTPVALCDAPSQRGGSWGDDDNIVFAPKHMGNLWRVASIGGSPQPVTELDQKRGDDTHRYPNVLPGAIGVLFTNGIDLDGEGTIDVQSFKTGKRTTLVPSGAYPRYLPSGHLVYMHKGTLFGAPMDLRRLEIGPSVPLLEDVNFHPGTGTAAFTYSQSGTFIYVAAKPEDQLRPIGVVTEKGEMEALPLPKARYAHPRVSPDGTRLAVTISERTASNIWLYDWRTQRMSRLTFMDGNTDFPVWTPDGKYLVFYADSPAAPGIYGIRSDGAGKPQRLVAGTKPVPWSISPHSERLSYAIIGGPNDGLYFLTLNWTDPAGPQPGVAERLRTSTEVQFSPDGRWLAAEIAQSGTPEIFVQSFPASGGQWQISSGGTTPIWSRARQEIFYRTIGTFRIAVVPYSVAGDSFSPAPARVWNDLKVDWFDVLPDGKHMVVITSPEPKETTHATFLLNFMDDLHRRLPAPK